MASPTRLLIAASGTGGHLFPAIALAQQLPDYQIEWLGTANRLETSLVPDDYPLNTISVEGLQQKLSLKTLKIIAGFFSSIWQTQKLIKEHQIDAVFTTGGYIAAPAILAARLQKKPAIIHESNYIPGKVTKFLSRWCDAVALGFAGTAEYLPQTKTVYVSTPVRSQFFTSQSLGLNIPDDAMVILVFGGSQGAVAINKLVREAASAWFELGAYVIHLTGENDPQADSLKHPQYICLPFSNNMAGLLQRANLAISRAGAGTITELAFTGTPAVLIPYPFAAEDHQTYNAQEYQDAGAGVLYQQAELTAKTLQEQVSQWLRSPQLLQDMAAKAKASAVVDSAERLAQLVRSLTADC
ncbi:undecaprenyldiphospho-muramoylpentapeptide beta-N-acetylglucosaminyltransferase [Pleurocapsa sp. CCALA 161]|uniref:undecaprenyldiphospho-muramoylpentapeptide beta-N-acetylglucosaminyltransferase n=1 Tax=Pleurocapsa sp. CCALA 161 TaxID=2107688 RepID=UPI000D0734B4|nr:undecaprenyldiphospho-muramoylpentapeptide beta-N-acetylglucosaminyltransferase [Pleurocapsa sp. CCALA 161]PSB07191.1 undecaprenyldiphospho-muramoylpentapeptide beta-N-acetylglucosaminyltransferase [Pleurocapsa sp. CCALA 161]